MNNYRNQDLRGRTFIGEALVEADFTGAYLAGARFINCNLTKADFTSAQLRAAEFSECVMDHANFRNAYARKAWIVNCSAQYANFQGCCLGQTEIHNTLFNEAIGNGDTMLTLQLEAYNVVIHKGVIAVGCRQHTLQEWSNMTEDDLRKMDGKRAVEFFKSPTAELILSLAKGQYV